MGSSLEATTWLGGLPERKASPAEAQADAGGWLRHTCEHVVEQGKDILHCILLGHVAQDGQKGLDVGWSILQRASSPQSCFGRHKRLAHDAALCTDVRGCARSAGGLGHQP